MDQSRAPYWFRRRRSPPRAQPGRLDTEYSLASNNRHHSSYLDPWIVSLLLEYKESIIKTDGQLGHVLKVLNEPRVYQDAEQEPETILHIGDGLHYIEVVVAGKAAKMSKQSMAQNGLSGIIGQFIVLQNYRVNFKRAAEMEDCRFYLTLECFQVMSMKREGKSLQNCNRELSVIQKIKDLWQKGFATQMWFNSGQKSQSVSQVLIDVNYDQLNILKQNAKDCLNLSGTSKLLDSEQLAVYPDTKWQLERKQNKMHQDIFTVPAEYLVISAENEAALSQSYIANTLQAVPEEDENIQEDDRSTVSFFSDSASLDGSLENPWDAVPGITLSTSSDASGTSHGLPQMQQMLLASPAEETNPDSNTCISHFLEPCDNTPRRCSAHTAPRKFPSLFHFQNREFLIETANQKPDLVTSTTSGQASELADSLPCGQPLNKSYLQSSGFPFSPVRHSNEGDFSSEPVSENRKDCPSLAHGAKGMTDRWKYFEAEKYMSAQRKRVPNEGEPSEASTPTCSSSSLEAVGHCSTETVTKTSTPNKRRVNRYLPLKLSSTPKKRRLEEIRDEQSQVFERCSCAERQLEERSKQEPMGIVTRKSKRIQQKENAKGDGFHFIRNPPTPELCTQVQSVRKERNLSPFFIVRLFGCLEQRFALIFDNKDVPPASFKNDRMTMPQDIMHLFI
ncbi:adrenocortical dysplasia protein homolog isoform X2 [Pituophis catenifer annectens]|uniref:adrenocortical dysplasia protein homolog isoform X2 n=1 Tax=Pituophis catenifer annectens TaxID=94852 RepID=UPI003993134C